MKKYNLLTICLLILTLNSFGQTSPTEVSTKEQEIKQEADRQMGINPITGRRDNENIFNPKKLEALSTPVSSVSGISRRANETGKLDAKEFERIKKSLIPSTSYLLKYKDFLNQKHTGIVKIVLDKNCDLKTVVSVQEAERCAESINFLGGGSYYSFSEKSHFLFKDNFSIDPVLFGWWDVHLIDDNFIVTDKFAQGIIAKIGDVNIENFTPESVNLAGLANFKIGKTLQQISLQSKEIENGISFNGVKYTNKVKADLNQTYIVRRISYNNRDYENVKSSKKDNTAFIFRVVGQENDGSLIVIWKNISNELRKVL